MFGIHMSASLLDVCIITYKLYCIIFTVIKYCGLKLKIFHICNSSNTQINKQKYGRSATSFGAHVGVPIA